MTSRGNDTQEVVVQMKFDDYKMVRNYIHNELGLNQAAVNGILHDMVRKVDIDKMIESKISDYLCAIDAKTRNSSGYFRTKLEERMDKLIDAEINKIFDQSKKDAITKAVSARLEQKLSEVL